MWNKFQSCYGSSSKSSFLLRLAWKYIAQTMGQAKYEVIPFSIFLKKQNFYLFVKEHMPKWKSFS